jgi:hypothetical protein
VSVAANWPKSHNSKRGLCGTRTRPTRARRRLASRASSSSRVIKSRLPRPGPFRTGTGESGLGWHGDPFGIKILNGRVERALCWLVELGYELGGLVEPAGEFGRGGGQLVGVVVQARLRAAKRYPTRRAVPGSR